MFSEYPQVDQSYSRILVTESIWIPAVADHIEFSIGFVDLGLYVCLLRFTGLKIKGRYERSQIEGYKC